MRHSKTDELNLTARLFYKFIFSLLVFLLTAAQTCAADLESQNFEFAPSFSRNYLSTDELLPGLVYSRQINGRENQLFTVRAGEEKCFRFLIEQHGIDVMIAIIDADGKAVKKVDRPSGAFGRETVTFTVPHPGLYVIKIEAYLKNAITGKYKISYTASAVLTETDRLRDLAENLTSEAEILRGGTAGDNKKEALRKFAEALAVWQQLGEIYEQAVVYYGIGYTNYELSNHYEAALNYNRAVKLHSQIGDEIGRAVNRAALGAVQYTLNENEFAAYNYQQAIEVFKKIGNVRGLGIAFRGLGTAAYQSGNYRQAFVYLNESLKWSSLANDKNGKARTHIMLAKLFLYTKVFDKAERQLIEAANFLGTERAKRDFDLNYYFGRLFLLNGRYEDAASHLKTSLNISRQSGDRLGEAQVLLELSRVETEARQLDKALEKAAFALDLIEKIRAQILDYRARTNFFAVVQPFYEHSIALLMQAHEREPNKNYNLRALEISEQSRARALLDQIERRRQIRQGKISPELLEQERLVRERLITALVRAKGDNTAKTMAEIQEIASQFIELEWKINQQSRSSEFAASPTLSVEQIQSFLDEETVLLEYAVAGQKVFLWSVSREEVKSFQLKAPAEKIEQEAKALYTCLSEPAVGVSEEKTCRLAARSLSEILLKPVAGDIAGKRLLIVKQNFLHYIPFDAFPHPNSQDRYLVETNEVISLASASLLNFLRQPKSENESPKTLAIFADPIFSPADGRLAVKNFQKRRFSDEEYLPRLFASKFEAERISSLAPIEGTLMKTGAAATRQALLETNLKDYRIIHFATHTLINDLEPEISAVVLSRFDENGNLIEGLLRPNDILRLDLNADLVVLSSCRSGAGKQIDGEGMLSLDHSFFAAGARRIIVTLWNVDDKVTAELMWRFYRNLLVNKKSISDALRRAKLEIMRDSRWKLPYYWASFNLRGD